MSNQAVGNVYQAIIDEVVNSSRVDFEENGVEDSVLEELRQVSCSATFAPASAPPSSRSSCGLLCVVGRSERECASTRNRKGSPFQWKSHRATMEMGFGGAVIDVGI